MTLRLPAFLVVGVILLTLVACSGNTPSTQVAVVPSATPRGPIVPTRATLEPTEQPSETPTEEPTVTATPTTALTATATPTLPGVASPTVETPAASITPQDTAAPVPITLGTTVDGAIGGNVPSMRYMFQADTSDVVDIQMNTTSGDLDPLVILLDPSGREVVRNDDDELGTSRNSFLRGFVIPTAGTYTIVATRFQENLGSTTGSFVLTLAEAGAAPPVTLPPLASPTPFVPLAGTPPPLPPVDGTVSLGQAVRGNISADQFARLYRFSGTQGQVITISMHQTSNDLDPYLIVLDPNGHELARNDDEEQTYNALIRGLHLPITGDYTIVATRFGQRFVETAGDFSLTVVAETGSVQPWGTFAHPIAFGVSQRGTINDQTPEQGFSFIGNAGDVITVRMAGTSGDLDSTLVITDMFGAEIARNDDDPYTGRRDSAIEQFMLPFDGPYTIIATRYQGKTGTTSGDFRVDLIQEQAAAPDFVPPPYAFLNPYKSGILIEGGDYGTGIYYAGDFINDSQQETGFQTMLTFQLPEIPPEHLGSVKLEFAGCSESGDGFNNLGRLTIYLDQFGQLTETTPWQPGQSATQITKISECNPVDITTLVHDLYQRGERTLQLRLVFRDATRNNTEDNVQFIAPRLTIDSP